MEKTPRVIIENNNIHVENLRDFDWRKIGQEKKYKNMNFRISDIKGIEVGVSHFSESNEGLAHVFTVFNLKDGRDISVSIETRRDGGEKFEF
jgi:hypothetical protein